MLKEAGPHKRMNMRMFSSLGPPFGDLGHREETKTVQVLLGRAVGRSEWFRGVLALESFYVVYRHFT